MRVLSNQDFGKFRGLEIFLPEKIVQYLTQDCQGLKNNLLKRLSEFLKKIIYKFNIIIIRILYLRI